MQSQACQQEGSAGEAADSDSGFLLCRWHNPSFVALCGQYQRRDRRVPIENTTTAPRRVTLTNSDMKFPLLQEILAIKNLPLQPMYSIRNIAAIFGVSARAIQNRVASGQLNPRDLPGRARFLNQDVEDFLQASLKKAA